jgi:AcrR family transcriptional regulator
MATARERILDAAARRFEGQGINTTGISDLIAEASVARMSLYHHFSSKDEVVVAYLRLRDEDWWRRLEERLASIDDPRERLLAVMSGYGDRVGLEGFRGCAFVNAAAELPPEHPGWTVIHEHKAAVRDRLRVLAEDAGLPSPLAEELFLLAEGAVVTAGVERSREPFAVAERAARRLLDAAG